MLITGLLIQIALAVEPIHQPLTVAHDVWDVIAEDLNNDEQLDVIALYADQHDAQERKGIYVFLANTDGHYPEQPSVDFPLGESTGDAFLTRRNGNSEIAVLTETGVTCYAVQDGQLIETDRCAMTSLFPLYTREPAFMRNVAFDLDADDSDEWVVPVIGGFEVWDAGEKQASLRSDMKSESSWLEGLSVTHNIPQVSVFDREDQSNKAIGLVGMRGVTFHFGENWEETRVHKFGDEHGDNWETRGVLDDINADGIPDLMITSTKGTADIEVRLQLYLANEELEFSSDPFFEMNSKGGLLVPGLVDLNGDDQLDLVVRDFQITVRNIVNFLIRKKITMKLSTHFFENGVLPEEESLSNSITMDISQDGEEAIHTYGDYNADGINELAVGTKRSALTISAITKNGALTKKPWATMDVSGFGIARTHDLDNSGTDDLIIIHPRGTHKKTIDVIRF